MCRICLLLVFFAAVAGCATPGDKGSWEEVRKDWNGDNMKMRGDPTIFNDTWNRPLQPGNR